MRELVRFRTSILQCLAIRNCCGWLLLYYIIASCILEWWIFNLLGVEKWIDHISNYIFLLMNIQRHLLIYSLDVDGKFLLGKVYISCTRQTYEVIIIDILYLQKLYNFINLPSTTMTEKYTLFPKGIFHQHQVNKSAGIFIYSPFQIT